MRIFRKYIRKTREFLNWLKFRSPYLLYADFVIRYQILQSIYKKEIDTINRKGIQIKSLSREQKKKIKEVWGWRYVNSKTFLILNSCLRKGIDIADYTPNEFFSFKLHPYFNRKISTIKKLSMDKNSFNRLFPYIRQPETVARCIKGIYYDKDYNPISFAEAKKKCEQHDTIIIKKSVMTGEGKNVHFLDKSDYERQLADTLKRYDDLIIQTIIQQHPLISSLHHSSVNGLRIYTLNVDGECHILSPYLKIGSGNSKMDNVSLGGLFCPVLDNAQLYLGVDYNLSLSYKSENGIDLSAITIPSFEKCKKLAQQGTLQMTDYCGTMIWDFAIGPDEEPILIETTAGFTYLYDQLAGHPWIDDPALRAKLIKLVG